ncbi:Sterol uptake control protein 2 [Verticillium dahliae VDG2]|nr:Sterol uptake control protein 2 [Verticillium dahliae VDG2]
MGSQIDSQDEFTVLVTGFGADKRYANSLSKPPTPSTLRGRSHAAYPLPLPPVRILVHPEAIRVNYQVVRGLVPTLWDQLPHDTPGNPSAAPPSEGPSPPRIDLCIHIGMAGPRPFYCIERRGHRDGYAMPDQGPDWVWAETPPELETDVDVRDALRRWRRLSPDDADLRISEDAGRYLCDFIYMSSLAHLYRRGERRRVVFLHVPCDASEEAVGRGTELATGLVRALVESEVQSRRSADIRKEDKIAVELRV